MGLDVQLYAAAEGVDVDAVRKIPDVFNVRVVGDTIAVDSLMRYWGPGYLRGWWPNIRKMIEAVQALCREVYYGPDDQDTRPDRVTPELLAELDALWDSHGR